MGATDAPAIHCSIDAEHQNGGVLLRGRVVSAIETDGNYRLDIHSRSRSGASNVRGFLSRIADNASVGQPEQARRV